MIDDEKVTRSLSTGACYSLSVMDELLASIAVKKKRLDELRPLSEEALAALEPYYDVELTYTSNAIEGNTLSAVETTLVIEKGITVGGKSLKDHLEALDHYDAIRYVRELARHEAPITEGDVRNLHRLVMQRSAPEIAGRYADRPRCVRTEAGRYAFPQPAEIPALMGILQHGLQLRRTRRKARFSHIGARSISILSMTATDAPRGF